LKEYLSREQEVFDIIMSLFNQEKAFEQHVGQYGDKRENKSCTEDKMEKTQETAIL